MPEKTSQKKSAAQKTTKSKASRDDMQGVNFEKAMNELETLVANMEEGEHSLEASLKDFERGVELTRLCQSALKEAEQKVQILSKKMGKEGLVPFEEEDVDA